MHAISPDLYHGRVGSTHDEATHLYKGLNYEVAVEEVLDSARYLRKELGCTTVTVTGFCMGGGLSFLASTKDTGVIDRAAPFYGSPLNFDGAKVLMPIQAHFGRLDHAKGYADPETASRILAQMEAAGKDYEFYWYEEAGHAFMNEARPEAYRKEDAELAFERLVRFTKKQ